MKYLFFLVGVILFVGGIALSVSGATQGWDAAIAWGPSVVGFGLIAAAVSIHIYDNWMAHQ